MLVLVSSRAPRSAFRLPKASHGSYPGSSSKTAVRGFSAAKSAVIHPTAIIAKSAVIKSGAEVGPYSILGDGVTIGEKCIISSHCTLTGRTTIGEGTRIDSYSCVGLVPQDKKYRGEETLLEIGSECSIHSRVVIHTGTKGGGGVTRLGQRVVICEGSHVAHDCIVGDNVVLSKGSTLAGHVVVEANANIRTGFSADPFDIRQGPNAGVVQRSLIGKFACVTAESAVSGSVIPYAEVEGNKAKLKGLNSTSLLQIGISVKELELFQQVLKYIFDTAHELKSTPWQWHPTVKERALSAKKWFSVSTTSRRKRKDQLTEMSEEAQQRLLEILNFVLTQDRKLVCF